MRTFIFLIIFLIGQTVAAKDVLPESGFVPGWIKDGKIRQFFQNDLYGHINGGAELFLEFGFEKLSVQHYTKDDAELILDIYQMENPLAALGIYLQKAGKEKPAAEIEARNTGNRFQLLAVKSGYYIQVNNYAGDEKLQPVMVDLVQAILAEIPENKIENPWQYLPDENRIPGTELLIRGPYALQPVYTFGKGDVFQLNGELFGMLADYEVNGAQKTVIVVPYPGSEKARAVFDHLINNLDPYLKVLEKKDNTLLFKDFQNKFGLLKLNDAVITAEIHLPEKPEL